MRYSYELQTLWRKWLWTSFEFGNHVALAACLTSLEHVCPFKTAHLLGIYWLSPWANSISFIGTFGPWIFGNFVCESMHAQVDESDYLRNQRLSSLSSISLIYWKSTLWRVTKKQRKQDVCHLFLFDFKH